MVKPILRTKSIVPSLKVKGRAIIKDSSYHVNNPGEPIGLLLVLTYSEKLIPSWTLLDNFSAPLWGRGENLISPVWAK